MPVVMEDWFMVLGLGKETKLNDELCLCCLTMCVFAIKGTQLHCKGALRGFTGRH
jgi:hypothetical protein